MQEVHPRFAGGAGVHWKSVSFVHHLPIVLAQLSLRLILRLKRRLKTEILFNKEVHVYGVGEDTVTSVD